METDHQTFKLKLYHELVFTKSGSTVIIGPSVQQLHNLCYTLSTLIYICYWCNYYSVGSLFTLCGNVVHLLRKKEKKKKNSST